jgi:hypothetical protein
MTASSHSGEDPLFVATGRTSLDEAVAWIAEDHPLASGTDTNAVLQALVSLPQSIMYRERAIQRLARENSRSTLDTASVLFGIEGVVAPTAYRKALDVLAWKSPSKTLQGLTPHSVAAAQHADGRVMETLALMAGLSYRDLHERLGSLLPKDPPSIWSSAQIAGAFAVIDSIVRGNEPCGFAGARAARPIELIFPHSASASNDEGWTTLERLRCGATTYELLLAQRAVGSAWLAHRNRTSGLISGFLAARVCELLAGRGLEYRRSQLVGGTESEATIEHFAGIAKQIGVVVLDHKHGAIAGVSFSVARDGGTARKTAGRLKDLRRARIPIYLVLAGRGWASRNETAELATTFDGRLYADHHLERLVEALARLTSNLQSES